MPKAVRASAKVIERGERRTVKTLFEDGTVEALIFVGFAGYMTQEVKTVCMKFHGAKIVFSSQTLAIATFQAQKLSKFVKGK